MNLTVACPDRATSGDSEHVDSRPVKSLSINKVPPIDYSKNYSETTQELSKNYPEGINQDYSEDHTGNQPRQALPDFAHSSASSLKRNYSLEGRVNPAGKVRDQLQGLTLEYLFRKSKELGQNMEFVLARTIVGWEEEHGVSLNLEQTVSLWRDFRARSEGKELQEAFPDFDTLIDEVERLYGYVQHGLRLKAVTRAKTYSRLPELAFKVHEKVLEAFQARPGHRHLASACRYLAEQGEGAGFFLSLIDAGKIISDKEGMDESFLRDKGRSALKALIRHGIIKRTKVGERGQGASEYEYLLDDLTLPKEGGLDGN